MDLRVWGIREAEDARAARTWRLRALTDSALRAISRTLDRGPAYVSTSWGKDSTVCAHLAHSVDPTVPLHHGRYDSTMDDPARLPYYADGVAYARVENPDCAAVASEYLARWPTEVVDVPWHIDDLERPMDRAGAGRARIMGIRAAESGSRALSARVHGVSTMRTCRPLLHWTTADVYAYLVWHDLPVHPAYACSMGGAIERDALRVDTIGGYEGANRGRREWERMYYRDALHPSL